ncbi:MAG: hypothetical protein AB1347_06550 [Acidobacteriota bacterium]
MSGEWSHLDGHRQARMGNVGRRRPAGCAATAVPGHTLLRHVVAHAEVAVDFERDGLERGIRVEANASAKDVTGVETGPIDLPGKTGGKSGRCER